MKFFIFVFVISLSAAPIAHARPLGNWNIDPKPELSAGISTKTLDGKIAYVKFTTLSAVIATQIRSVFEAVQKEKPRGIVIDLRDTNAGSLEAVQAIMPSFLPKGTPYMKHVESRGVVIQVTEEVPVFRKSQPVALIRNEKTTNEATIVIAMLQKLRNARFVDDLPSGNMLSSHFGASARMKNYVPIKPSGFVVLPDARVVREPLLNRDDALARAVSFVEELSPWATAARKGAYK